MSTGVLASRDNEVLNLQLNRPERGNALSADLVEAIMMEGVAQLGDAKLIALSGVGRHFCTGFDLSALEDQTEGDLVLRFIRVEQMLQAIESCPVPTLACAHGRTFGAGADLFVACDHRVCAADAQFSFPGSRFGVILGNRRLAVKIGQDRARDILITGRVVGATEALDIGLATAIVPPGQFGDAIADTAKRTSPDISLATIAAMRKATTCAQDEADLARLVRSVSNPGLKERLEAYANRVRGPPKR